MAAPAYATDLTDITTSFSLNWNLITEGGGGQNALTAPERDDGIYDDGSGVVCVSRNPFSTSIRGIAYDRALITVATDDAVFYWWKADVAAALDTFANFGVRLVAGSTLTDYRQYGAAGNDTYAKGGWRCTPIDVTNAGDLNRGTPGTPDYDTFGIMFDLPGSGPSKGFPFKISMLRHGRSIDITAGDSGDPATWDKLVTHAEVGTRRWGIVQETDTGASVQGITNWGTAATAVYSRDSNRSIVFQETFGHVVAEFSKIVFANASTDVEWSNLTFIALDAENRGVVEIGNNAAVSFLGCTFIDLTRVEDGGSNTVYDGSTFIGLADQITALGGSFAGCSFDSPAVAADESALVYNQTADPNTLLSGASFIQGTNAHHAIELGLSSPLSVTLDGVTFSGFGAAATNGSAIYVKRTAGTVTINLVNGADTPTIKTDGATVVIQQSVTLTLEPLVAGSAVTIADAADQTVYYDNGSTGTSAAWAYNASDFGGGELVNVVIIEPGFEPFEVKNFAPPATSQSLNVSQRGDTVFDNP